MEELNRKIDLLLSTLVDFKEEMKTLKADFHEHKTQVTTYQMEMTKKLDRIEATVLRIEAEQPKDIAAVLNQINKKINEHSSDKQDLIRT